MTHRQFGYSKLLKIYKNHPKEKLGQKLWTGNHNIMGTDVLVVPLCSVFCNNMC